MSISYIQHYVSFISHPCICVESYVMYKFRWGIEMPAIIARSISILSDAGLGMAMFSLGVWISDISLLYVSVILFLYGSIAANT